ncbi:hypothetical protein WMY93_022114 [Mugilogobius chulae]|uniref:Interferon gamma n=1 Tax=Mugilogobius chulae TaxID=88201 RepID=A0AAW0NH85_9GOBI
MDATARAVLFVCALLLVAQVRSSHIPATMNRTIQSLRQHYKIPRSERYNGKPVFSKEPLAGRENEVKKLFLGGILETYGKLLNKMLEQLPTPSPSVDTPANANANANTDSNVTVRTGLKSILKMVQNLKRGYEEQAKLGDELISLQNIATDNLVVQSKALAELPWLFEEASTLRNNDRKRRRRRHTAAKRQAKVGK